jgi:protein-S-isoprenylcysteine O-methyltransferase Ste14
MSFDLEKFRQSKAYDLLMGLPLILWFSYGVIDLRPVLGADARAVLADPANLLFNLRFYALFASAAFNLLGIYMIVMRGTPVLRSRGWLPRAFAIAGTFLGVGIIYLKPVPLSLGWQSVAAALVFLGGFSSIVVLANLGKSYSIMPEARRLVTGGPYAFARHPLYAAEIVTIIGSAIQFQQPWAGLLAVGVVALLVARSRFEEQVLSEAYPEYAQYRRRVKRFGFI